MAYGKGMSAATMDFVVIFVCFVFTIGVGFTRNNRVYGKSLKNHKLSDNNIPDYLGDDYNETKADDIYGNDVSALGNYTRSSNDHWQAGSAAINTSIKDETRQLNAPLFENDTNVPHFDNMGSTNNTWFLDNDTYRPPFNQSSLQFNNLNTSLDSFQKTTMQNAYLTNDTVNYIQSNLTSVSQQNITYFDFNNTLAGIPNGTTILTVSQNNNTAMKTGPKFIEPMPNSTHQKQYSDVPVPVPSASTSEQTTAPPLAVSTSTKVSTTQFPNTQVSTTRSTSNTIFSVTGTTQVSSSTSSHSALVTPGAGDSSNKPTADYNKPTVFTLPPLMDSFSSSSYSNSIGARSTTAAFSRDTTISTSIAYINGLQNYLNQRDKHYVTSVLIPVAAGILGALFIVCVAYSVKTCGKKRQYKQMHSLHSDQDSQRPPDMHRPTADRMMLLAESSDEDAAQW